VSGGQFLLISARHVLQQLGIKLRQRVRQMPNFRQNASADPVPKQPALPALPGLTTISSYL